MTTAFSPSGDPIRGVVRVLAAYHDQSQAEVALGAGIPKRTFIRRMHSGGWTVAEVNGLARHFDIGAAVLLDGPEALFGSGYHPNKSGCAWENPDVFDSAPDLLVAA